VIVGFSNIIYRFFFLSGGSFIFIYLNGGNGTKGEGGDPSSNCLFPSLSLLPFLVFLYIFTVLFCLFKPSPLLWSF
jgi:hypothetical protein